MTILEDLQKQKADLVENRTKLLLKFEEVKSLLDFNKRQTKLVDEFIERQNANQESNPALDTKIKLEE